MFLEDIKVEIVRDEMGLTLLKGRKDSSLTKTPNYTLLYVFWHVSAIPKKLKFHYLPSIEHASLTGLKHINFRERSILHI